MQIDIYNPDGELQCILSPESDGISEAYTERELNSASTLSFFMPYFYDTENYSAESVAIPGAVASIKNYKSKWQYLVALNLLKVDGREYVLMNPDAEDLSRDGEVTGGILTAHESWVLLGADYVSVSNDPQYLDPDWSDVCILSGGAALNSYEPGTADHALFELLRGTGWTLIAGDVEGLYDLETSKKSRLENINIVKDLWGGYLVWDSENHTLQLRDEEKWQNDIGYQIRYAKNLKTLNRVSDYKIATKLYAFGKENLNIASVNGGNLYVENYDFTTRVLIGVYTNPNISDAEQLLNVATRVAKYHSRPRYTYTCKEIHLEALPGHEHETCSLGDIVEVNDYKLGIKHKQRIYKEKKDLIRTQNRDYTLGDKGYSLEREIMEAIKIKDRINDIVTDDGDVDIDFDWDRFPPYEPEIPLVTETGSIYPEAAQDINKVTNSDFEVFDPVTRIPYYWTGCLSSPDACWRGTYSALITGEMKQVEIDSSGMADPAWWGDDPYTIVAFRHRIGPVTVSVHAKANDAAITLIDPVTGGNVTSVSFDTPASWREGFRFFRFATPSVGKVYLKFTGAGTYVDVVQMHGIQNITDYPAIYYPGPKSSIYEPVERTEWKIIPWATSTEITLVNLYTNMPCVNCTPMSLNETDFGSSDSFKIVAIPVTEVVGGVTYYSKVKILVQGSSVPTPTQGYIGVSAVCKGLVARTT